MIRYALKCRDGHSFDSWFQSVNAFDALARSGRLECPVCGSAHVEKALMTPRIASEAETTPVPVEPENAPAPPVDEAIEKLRKVVEAESDYVGRRFATEARAIHDGAQPGRAIHGEADAREVRGLLEDGVPILPLPFRDPRGTN